MFAFAKYAEINCCIYVTYFEKLNKGTFGSFKYFSIFFFNYFLTITWKGCFIILAGRGVDKFASPFLACY